jgi:type 1 glutamine amidotransferase
MNRIARFALAGLAVAALTLAPASAAEKKIKVMIIGGQNNHDWKRSTPFMEGILNADGHFDVTVDNAPPRDAPQADWDAWQPNFREFGCVVLDYNGQMWPDRVKRQFVDYVNEGGGVVAIHAANNSFTGWKEYEDMIGLLWRGKDYGESLYVDDDGRVVREAPGQGRGMGHGSQYDWIMTTRDPDHPITHGMPLHWQHKTDELYHGQRGPAQNVHILLTAYSDPNRGGTGKNEPIVWWVPYGEGRVVTDLMGHVGGLDCMKCVGFQVTLCRACEWVATGKCTTPIPENFPTAEATSVVE